MSLTPRALWLSSLVLVSWLSSSGCSLIVDPDADLIPGRGGSVSVGGASQGGDAPGGAQQGGGGAVQGGGGASQGGAGGVGGTGGSGGGPECTTAGECPGMDTECRQRTCDMGACGFMDQPSGTPLGTQITGDCLEAICDGMGMTTVQNDDADTLDDMNDCTADTCSAGIPSNDPVMQGTGCSTNGGTVCDDSGNCVECNVGADCMSGICTLNQCVPSSCIDTVQNGLETDVDCGGADCAPCADGDTCGVAGDCQSGVCTTNVCAAPACNDGVQNGDETDQDCGGATCNACGPGLGCVLDSDCVGGQCSGTVCLPTCTDAVTNGSETDVDCGGPVCGGCDVGDACSVGSDCLSLSCIMSACAAPSCMDGVQNGSETGTDCGGGACPLCGTGGGCLSGADCASGVCTSNLCVAPSCGDSVVQAGEGCDDGGTAAGDGCDGSCAVEHGFGCAGQPSVCTTTCGDSLVASTEGCDDGGTAPGDGCDGSCVVEMGWSCSGEPSGCNPVCGDTLIVGGETCDDGNVVPNDCCSAACQIEAGCEVEPNSTCAQAETIALSGSPLTGTVTAAINPAADEDWFSFTLAAPSSVKLETYIGTPGTCASTAANDTLIALIAPDCTTSLVSDDDDGPGWCSLIDPTVDAAARTLAAGTYRVRVRQSSGSATISPYTLRVTVVSTCGNSVTEPSEGCDDGNLVSGDGCSATCGLEFPLETEANNTCATANGPYAVPTTANGVVLAAAITPAADQDWFSFTIPVRADVRIETFDSNGPSTCSAIDTVIQAFQSDCTTQLGPSKDQGGVANCSRIDPAVDSYVRQLPAGTYMVKANAFSASATFNYTLQVRMTSQCGNSIQEGFEQCDGGVGCAADCTLLPVCGNGLLQGGETCDDGNMVSNDGCSAACAWETNNEVEPNDTIADADTNATNVPALLIDGNRNILGGVSSGTDKDIYKLVVAANNTVIHLETFDSSGYDCRTAAPFNMLSHSLRVLNSGGTEVVVDYETSGTAGYTSAKTFQAGIGVCAALSYRLDAGTYYVQIDRSAALAAYFLRVTFQTPGSEIEPNDVYTTATATSGRIPAMFGDHTVSTDVDFYAVTVPAGGSIRAEIVEGDGVETCESNNIDSSMALFGPTGTLISTTGDDAGRGFCSMFDGTGATPLNAFAHNLAAGTYYIRVQSFSTSATNPNQFNYRLVVDVGY